MSAPCVDSRAEVIYLPHGAKGAELRKVRTFKFHMIDFCIGFAKVVCRLNFGFG